MSFDVQKEICKYKLYEEVKQDLFLYCGILTILIDCNLLWNLKYFNALSEMGRIF
jgi:hypothetical protein